MDSRNTYIGLISNAGEAKVYFSDITREKAKNTINLLETALADAILVRPSTPSIRSPVPYPLLADLPMLGPLPELVDHRVPLRVLGRHRQCVTQRSPSISRAD